MNKAEKEFYEYLVNMLITKGVFLTEAEQKQLTDKLGKLGPPFTEVRENGKLKGKKK